MNITAFDLAQRFVGLKEIPGSVSNPAVLAMLKLDNAWPDTDEVPWCSAFVNYIAWLLRLPRSKSLLARSWLGVGTPDPSHLQPTGFDVVILKQAPDDPGPEHLTYRGHVGFLAGWQMWASKDHVLVLGGNQGNSVSIQVFPANLILGIRRLA